MGVDILPLSFLQHQRLHVLEVAMWLVHNVVLKDAYQLMDRVTVTLFVSLKAIAVLISKNWPATVSIIAHQLAVRVVYYCRRDLRS